MGYFSHIVLALAAVIAAEAGFETGWVQPLALLLLLPIPHLLAKWIRNRSLQGRFRVLALGTKFLTYSPIALQCVAVSVFGWFRSVEIWVGASPESTEMSEFAIALHLAPFILFEFLAIDARSRLFASQAKDIAKLRGYQYRMLLSGLVPLGIYMVLASVLSFNPTLRAHVEEIEIFYMLFAVLALSIFALSMPAILRNTWETTPLTEGWAFQVLTDVARRAHFKCSRLLVWKTGNQVSNAAILGFHAKQRCVLFTDSLLAELNPRELAAVFAHEIGHARCKHVQFFAAWTIGYFLAAGLALSHLEPEAEWQFITVGIAVFVLWYLGFGYLSRRFELEADLESLAITGDGEALLSALDSVGGGVARHRRSWRHFSTAKRAMFMSAQIRDRRVGERHRASLKRWKIVGTTLFVIAVCAQLVAMSSQWTEGWINANLRLGRYSEAYDRLDDSEIDEQLATLVRFAHEQSEEQGTISESRLSVKCVNALGAYDVVSALNFLELGARRKFTPDTNLYHQLRADLQAAQTDEEVEAALESARAGWAETALCSYPL